MKNVSLTLTLLATITFVHTNSANAQDWLNRIDSVINKVDQTISSGERAQNTADRVIDKIPEKQQTQETQNAADQAQNSEAEEEAILRQAREIEERKILEQAERIKRERGYN